MLEIIVFAITFVAAQCVAGLIIMGLMMNKRFLKKYLKCITDLTCEIETEKYELE